MRTKGKILVIRGGAIGDFILTLPAITALRQQFPEAHLELLGYPHIAQLALVGGLVDRVQSIEAGSLAGFFARSGELNPDLADYFSEFDLIISYLYDPDEIFRTNVGRCTVAQFIVGRHRADDSAAEHASKVYLKPLERLAIFDADTVPRLKVPGSPSGTARLALHPGSGSEKKNWPEANWARLLNLILRDTELRLLVVGGEAEAERMQRLTAALPPDRTMVMQSRPLTEVAAGLQQCTGFVGHDSGISHLAAALGLRCLLLWGQTVAEVWRPPGENVELARAVGSINTITAKEVFGRIIKLTQMG